MICFMPNFASHGRVGGGGEVWSPWQRINSFSASPVIFFSCIPQVHSMCSINPGWVMGGYIIVIIIIIMSINRSGSFKQSQVEEPKTSFKIGSVV